MQDHLSAIKRLVGIVAVALTVVTAMGTAASLQSDQRIPTQYVASVATERG